MTSFTFHYTSSISLPVPTSPSESSPLSEDESISPFRFSPTSPRTYDLDLHTTLYIYSSQYASLDIDEETYLPKKPPPVLIRQCRSSDYVHPGLMFGEKVYIEERLEWFTIINVYSTPESAVQDSYRIWLVTQDGFEFIFMVLDVPSRWVIMKGMRTQELSPYRPANLIPDEPNKSRFSPHSPEPISLPSSPSKRSFRKIRKACSGFLERIHDKRPV